jgi:hypothetical protein
MKRFGMAAAAIIAALQTGMAPGVAAAADATLPVGTRLYIALDQPVTSKRGEFDVGDIVRCRIWRDVEAGGVVFIKAGAPATCRVDKINRRNMGGFEGKVAIGAVETKAVDGQNVVLSGGYNKEGSGHKAVVWTAGLILFLPILFVPGGNAELPPGTVFDAETGNDIVLASNTVAAGPRKVDLRTMVGGGFTAEFMLDDFVAQTKKEVFRIKVATDETLPRVLVIDNVNGKPITPIPLSVKNVATQDGATTAIAEVAPKVLAKHFARGINRFEVAYNEGGERKATEVVMDVQM